MERLEKIVGSAKEFAKYEIGARELLTLKEEFKKGSLSAEEAKRTIDTTFDLAVKYMIGSAQIFVGGKLSYETLSNQMDPKTALIAFCAIAGIYEAIKYYGIHKGGLHKVGDYMDRYIHNITKT